MRETGRLWEEFPAVCEAAERVLGSANEPGRGGAQRTLVERGLEVARTADGVYEVRCEGLLVFHCRNGERPEVFKPGEWIVRLMRAGRSVGAGP